MITLSAITLLGLHPISLYDKKKEAGKLKGVCATSIIMNLMEYVQI